MSSIQIKIYSYNIILLKYYNKTEISYMISNLIKFICLSLFTLSSLYTSLHLFCTFTSVNKCKCLYVASVLSVKTNE